MLKYPQSRFSFILICLVQSKFQEILAFPNFFVRPAGSSLALLRDHGFASQIFHNALTQNHVNSKALNQERVAK